MVVIIMGPKGKKRGTYELNNSTMGPTLKIFGYGHKLGLI